MPTLQEKIAQAKAAGYTDDQITQHLSSDAALAPKIKQATEAGYKPDQIVSHLVATVSAPAKEETSLMHDVGQGIGNLVGGAVRGAGSIGATLLYPIDKAQDLYYGDRGPTLRGLVSGEQPMSRNEERRAKIDNGLRELGAEPDSMIFKTGKLVGEIAGTAGAGGIAGNAIVRAAPILARVGVAAPTVANLAEAASTAGFRAGNATGAANVLTRAAGGAINGAASTAMADPENTLKGAGIGAALPGAAKLVGKAGVILRDSVAGQAVSDSVVSLARRAKELGIEIPADRIANSKPLNALASTLNYVPLSGRAATEKTMETGLNRALSRTFGQDSENVTGALRKASDELGAKFDHVLTNNTVKVDNQFLTELAAHEQTANNELGAEGASIIKKQIDEILSKGASGEIDGQAAYNIKKTLDRIGQRNSNEAHYASEMRKSLMGALDRSLPPEEAAAFATTRKQYGNMLALEKIAKNGAEGDISVARLANMKNINNPDLQELADISAQFVRPRESQHGAMQRAVVGGGGLFAAMNGILPGSGLAVGAGIGRATNSILKSNALKEALMSGPQPTSDATNKLLQAAFRAAPHYPLSR